MIFNEWIEENSLFTEINTIKPFSFIDSYGAEKLDLLYKTRYGLKTIPRSIEGLTVKEVANIIVISYGFNWENKYTLLTDEIMLGVDSKTVTNETVSDDEIKVLDSSNTNQVSAYNDDTLSTNDSSSDNLNEDRQRDKTTNEESTRKSLNAIKSQLELFNSNFIIDVVCKDVSKALSLSIY